MELNNDEIRRYSRHLILPEVGLSGQKKICSTSVLCIGAGGLGELIHKRGLNLNQLYQSFIHRSITDYAVAYDMLRLAHSMSTCDRLVFRCWRELWF